MPTLLLPNTIEIDTTADAVEVEQNYSVIQQWINSQLINRDGAVAMTGQLQLVGDPLSDRHAATKGYVDALLPVGVMLPYGGAAVPAGQWALCNGASLPTATYPKLFSVLGFRYGGSGGTFNVPNMAGMVPIGLKADDTRFDATGKTGGSRSVILPQHFHGMTHDHPQFDTSGASVGHTHTMAHDHPAATGTTAAHHHTGRFINVHIPTTGTVVSLFITSQTGAHGSAQLTYPDPSGAGSATVNVPSYSGNTGSHSQNHTHTANVPNYVGNTANAGTANAEHVPPFTVVQYIIRVDQQ